MDWEENKFNRKSSFSRGQYLKNLWKNLSVSTKLIITTSILSLIFFLVSVFFSESPEKYSWLLGKFALQPIAIMQGKNIWTLFTHIFIHGSLAHLFFNMFSLFFVGRFLEKIIGRKRFFWFFLISGLFAGLFFAISSGLFGTSLVGSKIFGDPSILGVGASGAIFGFIGLMAVLIPFSRVYLIVGPLIAIVLNSILPLIIPSIGLVKILDWAVMIYLFISIFSMFSPFPNSRKIALPVEMPLWLLPIVAIVPLLVVGLFFPLPIANIAHLGGLIAGIVYGVYLKRKYPKKTRIIKRIFS